LSGSFGKKKKLLTNRIGLPQADDFLKMVGNYLLVALGLIIFNAQSMEQAIIFMKGLFQMSNLSVITAEGLRMLSMSMFFAGCMFIAEWHQRSKEYALQIDANFTRKAFRYAIY